MSLDATQIYSIIIPTGIAIATGIVGLWKVFNEYKLSNVLRKEQLTLQRQQILFPLIKEFEDSKLEYAKQILDGYSIKANQTFYLTPEDETRGYVYFKQFLKEQFGFAWTEGLDFEVGGDYLELKTIIDPLSTSGRHTLLLSFSRPGSLNVMTVDDKIYTFHFTKLRDKIVISFSYHISMISTILRDHKINSVIAESVEDRIRKSFDALLDFFGKLGYLLDMNLITEDELLYFQYYLRKIIHNKSVPEDKNFSGNSIMLYCKVYQFELFALLLKKINKLPDSLESVLPGGI